METISDPLLLGLNFKHKNDDKKYSKAWKLTEKWMKFVNIKRVRKKNYRIFKNGMWCIIWNSDLNPMEWERFVYDTPSIYLDHLAGCFLLFFVCIRARIQMINTF